MKAGEFWASFAGQVVASLAPLIVLAVVGLVIWKKIFGQTQTVTDVVNNTVDAAVTIPGGLLSVAKAALNGESEGNYMTQDQAKQFAKLQLTQKLAGA